MSSRLSPSVPPRWRASAATLSALLGLIASGCSTVLGIGEVPPEPRDAGGAFDGSLADTSVTDASADLAPATAGVRPPLRPSSDSPATKPPKQLVFAIRRFHFGRNDVTDAAAADAVAWRKLGFDIDGVTTTQAAALAGTPGTCKAVDKAPLGNLTDGEDGRDNSFGANLFPLINGAALGKVEENLVRGIAQGSSPTILFVLDDVGEGEDDTFVSTTTYLTSITSPAIAPKWDGTDLFAIDRLSLTSTQVTDAKIKMLDGYLSGDTLASGTFNDTSNTYSFYFPLVKLGFLPISFTTLTLVIKLDRAHEKAISAVLTGVIEPGVFQGVMDQISAAYLGCNQSLSDGLLKKIYEACDVTLGAKDFLDPTGTKACDAISVAIGLDLERVAFPQTSQDTVTAATCSDAGM